MLINIKELCRWPLSHSFELREKYRHNYLKHLEKILYTNSALTVLAFWVFLWALNYHLLDPWLFHIFSFWLFLPEKGSGRLSHGGGRWSKLSRQLEKRRMMSSAPYLAPIPSRSICGALADSAGTEGLPSDPLAPEEAVGMTLSTEYFTPPGCRLHSVCSLTRGVRMCKSLVSWVHFLFIFFTVS